MVVVVGGCLTSCKKGREIVRERNIQGKCPVRIPLRQLSRYVALYAVKHIIAAVTLSRLDLALIGLPWSTVDPDPCGSTHLRPFTLRYVVTLRLVPG